MLKFFRVTVSSLTVSNTQRRNLKRGSCLFMDPQCTFAKCQLSSVLFISQDSLSLSHNIFNLFSFMNPTMQDVTFGNTAGHISVTSVPEMVSSVFLDSTRFVRPASRKVTDLFSQCTRWSMICIPPPPPSCPTGWKSQNGWHPTHKMAGIPHRKLLHLRKSEK